MGDFIVLKISRISIHAPREGERLIAMFFYSPFINISIHAPREGERLCYALLKLCLFKFQSTLPARGRDFALVKPF